MARGEREFDVEGGIVEVMETFRKFTSMPAINRTKKDSGKG